MILISKLYERGPNKNRKPGKKGHHKCGQLLGGRRRSKRYVWLLQRAHEQQR